MIADGLAMASPYTRPNANPTGTPQATPTITGRFRLIPARRGQAMPDPLPNPPWGHPLSCRTLGTPTFLAGTHLGDTHLGDTHFSAAGAGMVSVTIGHS